MNSKADAIMDALSNIDENYIAAAGRDRKQSRKPVRMCCMRKEQGMSGSLRWGKPAWHC